METAYVCGTRDLVFQRIIESKREERIPKDNEDILLDVKLRYKLSFTEFSENISINVSDFDDRCSEHFDENILDAVERHVSVNYDDDKGAQVHQYAHGILQYIIDKSQEIEPRLKIKIIESGSFFSNLRVGMPYEFDFMLDITSTFSDGELDYGYSVEKIQECGYSPSNINTFMYRIHPNRNTGIFNEPDEQNYLHSKDVKKFMFGVFKRVIEDGECKTKWDIHRYSTDEDTSGPAFQISLHFKDTAILIDLVPCLQFPASNISTELPQLQHSTELLLKTLLGEDQLESYLQNLPEKILLVCKSSSYGDKGLFRLSTSMIEKDIYLNHLDHKYLQALKLTKYYFQIFFVDHMATNADTFFSENYPSLLINNDHPFSSQSYLPSYAITNLFFHFLKIVMCFPSQNHDKSAFHKDIVMMFMKFVYDVIGHCMPLAISKNNRWQSLSLGIHGWCFCHTNTISVKFDDKMHNYFRNSMAEYIRVLKNILSVSELHQFPLVGQKPEFTCVKCFDEDFLTEITPLFYHYLPDNMIKRGQCQLHSWSHQEKGLANNDIRTCVN